MTSTPPSIETQKALIQEEIKANQQQFWMTSLRAKSFKKAGFDDLAKTNAEMAAKLEAYIEILEEELKRLK